MTKENSVTNNFSLQGKREDAKDFAFVYLAARCIFLKGEILHVKPYYAIITELLPSNNIIFILWSIYFNTE